MSSSREGINPLRPYYIPPSLGLDTTNGTSPPAASSTQVFGGSARDLLPDLDYSDYLESSPSVSSWFRDGLDSSIRRYLSTLTGQPLDVAKTILQAYVAPDALNGSGPRDSHRRHPSTPASDSYEDEEVCESAGLGKW